MAAVIRVRGEFATYDRKTGLWTSNYEPLEWRANRFMSIRRPSGTYLEETLDFERTAAKYVIERYGEGEIVHVDPWHDDSLAPQPDGTDRF